MKFSQFKSKHGLSYTDIREMFDCSLSQARNWSKDQFVPEHVFALARALDIALIRYSKEYNISNSASHQVTIHNAVKQIAVVENELQKLKYMVRGDIDAPQYAIADVLLTNKHTRKIANKIYGLKDD